VTPIFRKDSVWLRFRDYMGPIRKRAIEHAEDGSRFVVVGICPGLASCTSGDNRR
jgi:hypothetical protein